MISGPRKSRTNGNDWNRSERVKKSSGLEASCWFVGDKRNEVLLQRLGMSREGVEEGGEDKKKEKWRFRATERSRACCQGNEKEVAW